jgi:hypothetical protein
MGGYQNPNPYNSPQNPQSQPNQQNNLQNQQQSVLRAPAQEKKTELSANAQPFVPGAYAQQPVS